MKVSTMHARPRLFRLGLAASIAAAVLGGLRPGGHATPGIAIDPADVHTVLPQDAIRAIDAPVFEQARAATDMRDEERVLGLVIGDDARAYPVTILSAHEIVNDVVGGEPVAVTW